MSFDVHLTIVGICNMTAGNKQMHVTMPRDHHHKHYGRLYYDTAYQSAGNTEYKRVFHAHKLNDTTVDVPAHTAELDLALPGDIVAASDLKWGKLKPEMLSSSHGTGSKAVVSLGCGGVSDYVSTRTFKLDGKVKQPANVITWTIRGISKPTFDFTIAEGIAPKLVQLHPMRGCVRMFLVNVPKDELPNRGFHVFPSNVTGKLDHIDEYMSLFDAAKKVTVEETALPVVGWQEEGAGPYNAAEGEKAAAGKVSLMTWVGACFSLRGQT